MTKTIEVVIGKDGNAKVSASGFTGMSCLSAMAPLEDKLGTPDGPRDMHPEPELGLEQTERALQ